MLQLVETDTFSKWLGGLRDSVTRTRIQARLDRLALGNPGDVKAIGEGVSEMRIHHGPGYRVYFMRSAKTIIVLLAGGDKRTQRRDIAVALDLAKSIRSMK
ncbi:MAG TPA: type II toxin-antitoxin system RelE/ParE family toxin [Rhizomicrobium sp.]|jgi:putative addiction module killer protein|nr:type II toxin-antitoxin system RelE/ParE family toxin [Rhizomicrobium sp.]